MACPKCVCVSTTNLRYRIWIGVLTALAWGAALAAAWAAEEKTLREFDLKQLTGTYYSEGANAGDIDGDGQPDAVYGPYWFKGPEFTEKFEIYRPVPQDVNRYSNNNFFNWIYDFDGDGDNDVLTVGIPAHAAYVYENPGKDGLDKHWKRHRVSPSVTNESPQFTSVVGDERPELVCTFEKHYGYFTPNWEKPFEPWKFHPVSDDSAPERFGHGLGVGDVNGDGRMDILQVGGWYEQPEGDGEGRWKFHKVKFSDGYGGADMFVYDVDGDGLNDVVTSLQAHDYGLAWYQQVEGGDEPKFEMRRIMGKTPEENKYGLVFTEPHGVALVDMDGDGLKDIVTGKTYWSHHRKSPQWDAGAVVYVFKLVRGEDGVDWVPYLAAPDCGIGRQVSIVDVNQDGMPDIVLGGIKGGHVLVQKERKVDEATWKSAQPKEHPASAQTAK